MAKAGRPRTFSEEQVLESLMHIFWKKGFALTSIADIEALTGLPRMSIYNVIGDKETIFEKAIDRYLANALSIVESRIASGKIDDMINFIEEFSSLDEKVSPSSDGCFIINTAITINQLPRRFKGKIVKFRKSVIEAYGKNLLSSIDDNIIDLKKSQVESLATMLVATIWGVVVTIRLYGNNSEVRPAVTYLASMLRELKLHK